MDFQQNIFLVSSIIGALIGFALVSRVFTKDKGDFFLGLVVLILAVELFFSWGALSGLNNTPGIFPYWMFLNYLIIPPSIWIFVNYHIDDNFELQSWHLWLFLPALLAYGLDVWSSVTHVALIEYSAWVWFTQYLPLLALIYVLGYFWIKYFQFNRRTGENSQRNSFLIQLRFMMLMISLTLVCLLWLTFELIGYQHYEFIEYTFIFLFLGFAFLNFLESRNFPDLAKDEKDRAFPNYDDQKSLKMLEDSLQEQQSYLKPNYPLKELALEVKLPARYVSFLINHYHKKNYKEFINQYRIETFLQKIEMGENETKTLLGLALDSGFSSKSTFNQVFKKHMGKSPSAYLN